MAGLRETYDGCGVVTEPQDCPAIDSVPLAEERQGIVFRVFVLYLSAH